MNDMMPIRVSKSVSRYVPFEFLLCFILGSEENENISQKNEGEILTV